MIKISVIITTYNSEQSIGDVITSMISQNGIHKDFELELIVVDDQSTDSTVEIIQGFKEVKLFVNETNSGGPNKGRNYGLSVSTGDYISINDHDDIWVQNKIQSLLPYLSNEVIVFSGYFLIDSRTNSTKEIISRQHKDEVIYFKKNETFMNILLRNWKNQNTYMSTILFPKSKKNILFEVNFGMLDYEWVLGLFENMFTIQINKPLIYRNINGNNLSLNSIYRINDFYTSLNVIESYAKQYPTQFKIAYKRAFSSKAKFHYMIGDRKLARFFFTKAEWSVKNLLYYMSTFIGHSFINKKFKVFGL